MQYVQFVCSRADTGAILPNCQGFIYATGTATLATLFDSSGNAISNPITADNTGLAGFAAADGGYDIQLQSGGYTSPKIVNYKLRDTSLPPILPKTANYTVSSLDITGAGAILEVDATTGQKTITVPPALGSSSTSPLIKIVKVDPTSNNVLISDGSHIVDSIVVAAGSNGLIGGWREVYSNGTTLRCFGGGTKGAIADVTTTSSLLALFGTGSIVANGATFRTTGRTVQGDGGGCDFYYNASDTTSADNGGTLRVDAANRRWYAVINGDVSSALWGPDPTGVTDATVALQNAINWCWDAIGTANPWNGNSTQKPWLIIEPGSYQLNNSLTVPTGIAIRARYAPVHTENSTRLIMNSVGQTPARIRKNNTGYIVGQSMKPSIGYGYWFTVQSITSGGVSAASAPAWNTTTGSTTVDGQVTWVCSGPAVTTDNRNKPIMTFARNNRSAAVLLNQFVQVQLQWLEFWYVTIGGTISNPLVNGIIAGDYPNGGSLFFGVDTIDTYLNECVFQHGPAAININAPHGTGPDGQANSNSVNFYAKECEFDASSSGHLIAVSTQLDCYFTDCEIFNGISTVTNCTGNLEFAGAFIIGNAQFNCPTGTSFLNSFSITGSRISRLNGPPTAVVNGATFVAITNNTLTGGTNQRDFELHLCKVGSVSNNTFDNSGYNSTFQSAAASIVAGIYMDACGGSAGKGFMVQGNNFTDSLGGGTYNGYGIALVSVSGTSSNNLVSNNNVLAGYNSGLYSGAPIGSDNYINLQPGDNYGMNYTAGGTHPGQLLNATGGIFISGIPMFSAVSTSATTGIDLTTLSLANGIYDIYAEAYVAATPGALNFATYKMIVRNGGGSILQKVLETNNAASGTISSSGTTVTFTYVSSTAFLRSLWVNRMAIGSFG